MDKGGISVMPTFTSDFLLKNPPERTESIIGDGLLPVSGKLLIIAETGIGKSVFAMDIAMCIVLGLPLFGALRQRKDKSKDSPYFPVKYPSTVHYIDAELGQAGMYERFQKLYERYGIASLREEITVTTNESKLMLHNTMDRKGFDEMKELVKEHSREVLIVDPFIEFHELDENSPAIHIPLGKLREIQDETGCAVIMPHHASGKDFYTNKGIKVIKDDIDLARGHSSIVGWADTVMVLTTEKLDTRCFIEIRFPKCRRGKKPTGGVCFVDFARMYVMWVASDHHPHRAAAEKKFLDTYNKRYPLVPEGEEPEPKL